MEMIIDAMGGDHAPEAIVRGAVMGLTEYQDIRIVLTGDKTAIDAVLSQLDYDKSRIDIIHTTEIIHMDDPPVKSVKEKTDSSLVVALNETVKRPGSIVISAGCTGALVAGATLIVRRLPGVKRPAFAPVLPTKTGHVLLVDGGANVDSKPRYLEQFGIMGSVYMEKVFGIKNPKVGLINNGSEAEKGNELTKEAYELLEKASINFVGNAEGRDLLSGDFDVLVCDGFVGNIVLKLVEGSAKTILGMMKTYIKESIAAKIGAVFMKSVFRKLKKKMDYEETGGALLLGLNGGVVKAHGSSDARAIFSAIRVARNFITGDVVNIIKKEVAGREEGTPV
ncbi:MAG: phosphate acyltransferase PlsX [Christensenellaceae bacterium]